MSNTIIRGGSYLIREIPDPLPLLRHHVQILNLGDYSVITRAGRESPCHYQVKRCSDADEISGQDGIKWALVTNMLVCCRDYAVNHDSS